MSLLPSMLFGWSPRLAADSLLHLTSAELFIFQDCFLPGVASLDGLPSTAVLALLRLLFDRDSAAGVIGCDLPFLGLLTPFCILSDSVGVVVSVLAFG